MNDIESVNEGWKEMWSKVKEFGKIIIRKINTKHMKKSIPNMHRIEKQMTTLSNIIPIAGTNMIMVRSDKAVNKTESDTF